MKKSRLVALAGVLLVGLALAVGAVISRASLAQTESATLRAAKGDVVLIRCETSAADLHVSAYQGSTAAPPKKSSGCAESVSLLLKDGFAIRDMGRYTDETKGYMVITLIR